MWRASRKISQNFVARSFISRPALNHTVLFVGNSGVGKTSIINGITGENHVIGDPNLGTKREDLTPYSLFSLRSLPKIQFEDTCGLNGTQGAAVNHAEAMKVFIEITAKIRGELSLVVFVRKAGPSDELDAKNLSLINIEFPKVKKVMIVNHCYAELKKTQDNYHGLYSQYGIDKVLAIPSFRFEEASDQKDYIKTSCN